MKKLAIIIVVVMSLLMNEANSQNLIAVQNGGAPVFYTSLDSAITHAQNGDTIYIPGGSFTINDTINKCIHLIGAGHHPDSANVTSRTLIYTGYISIVLTSGADYGSATGIFFNGPYGYTNIMIIGPVIGYTISRCYLSKGIYENSSLSNNLTITECIIGGLNLNGSNHFIYNNTILGNSLMTASTIKNNVFILSQDGYTNVSLGGSDCIIENNIFKTGNTIIANNTIYHNNINAGVNGISGTNQGSGNFLDNVPLESIFVSYDPATIGGDGIYSADFHLPINSPYKNAGRDGTDIGIYGGAFPWKEGSVPFNPHFQSVQIAPTTDSTGNLNVNIKVAAQDH